MKKTKTNASVANMWMDFIENNAEFTNIETPNSWYFCDNKKDADECAELVILGIKRATTASLWWYETQKERLPQIGDLFIITNWDGLAKAIIKTTKVEHTPFNEVTEEYAATEGEGDKSLEYWREVHWNYFAREMESCGEKPSESMILLCEYFEAIWI